MVKFKKKEKKKKKNLEKDKEHFWGLTRGRDARQNPQASRTDGCVRGQERARGGQATAPGLS